jgi:hypothetical protein
MLSSTPAEIFLNSREHRTGAVPAQSPLPRPDRPRSCRKIEHIRKVL